MNADEELTAAAAVGDPVVVPLPRYETVPCPECGSPAVIIARFSNARVEYLRIRCRGPLTMVVQSQSGAAQLRSA